MQELTWELTVQRPGDEPRVKTYLYAKSAQDGFDTAVTRKGRLATSIVLEEVDAAGRRELRRWERADAKVGPTILYLLTDANDEAVEYVAEELCPSIEDIKLVPFPLAWSFEAGALADDPDSDNDKRVYYSVAQRLQKMVDEGLFNDTHANHCFWLPDHNAELMVVFVAAYHTRYGRFPYIVTSDFTGNGYRYSVVDLNKVMR